MESLRIGDIVARKSYGGDVHFKICEVVDHNGKKPVYVLKGLLYRLVADSDPDDLVVKDPTVAYREINHDMQRIWSRALPDKRSLMTGLFQRLRSRPGRILHIDSSSDFLERCIRFYREEGVAVAGKVVEEKRQPEMVKPLLERYKPDVLVLTGHDGIKKDAANLKSVDSYRNSRYFIESVRIARKFQPDPGRMFIFAGACQSYYEAIMSEGANFASSPGRILINALDPGIVGRKISLTDRKKTVTPSEVIILTITGSKGIGGIESKGQMDVM